MIRLLGNRLIVLPLLQERLGRIYLPDSARDANNVGGPKQFVVRMVGQGRRLKDGSFLPLEMKVGDRVICASYTTGDELSSGNEQIVNADQVIAVIPQ